MNEVIGTKEGVNEKNVNEDLSQPNDDAARPRHSSDCSTTGGYIGDRTTSPSFSSTKRRRFHPDRYGFPEGGPSVTTSSPRNVNVKKQDGHFLYEQKQEILTNVVNGVPSGGEKAHHDLPPLVPGRSGDAAAATAAGSDGGPVLKSNTPGDDEKEVAVGAHDSLATAQTGSSVHTSDGGIHEGAAPSILSAKRQRVQPERYGFTKEISSSALPHELKKDIRKKRESLDGHTVSNCDTNESKSSLAIVITEDGQDGNFLISIKGGASSFPHAVTMMILQNESAFLEVCATEDKTSDDKCKPTKKLKRSLQPLEPTMAKTSKGTQKQLKKKNAKTPPAGVKATAKDATSKKKKEVKAKAKANVASTTKKPAARKMPSSSYSGKKAKKQAPAVETQKVSNSLKSDNNFKKQARVRVDRKRKPNNKKSSNDSDHTSDKKCKQMSTVSSKAAPKEGKKEELIVKGEGAQTAKSTQQKRRCTGGSCKSNIQKAEEQIQMEKRKKKQNKKSTSVKGYKSEEPSGKKERQTHSVVQVDESYATSNRHSSRRKRKSANDDNEASRNEPRATDSEIVKKKRGGRNSSIRLSPQASRALLKWFVQRINQAIINSKLNETIITTNLQRHPELELLRKAQKNPQLAEILRLMRNGGRRSTSRPRRSIGFVKEQKKELYDHWSESNFVHAPESVPLIVAVASTQTKAANKNLKFATKIESIDNGDPTVNILTTNSAFDDHVEETSSSMNSFEAITDATLDQPDEKMQSIDERHIPFLPPKSQGLGSREKCTFCEKYRRTGKLPTTKDGLYRMRHSLKCPMRLVEVSAGVDIECYFCLLQYKKLIRDTGPPSRGSRRLSDRHVTGCPNSILCRLIQPPLSDVGRNEEAKKKTEYIQKKNGKRNECAATTCVDDDCATGATLSNTTAMLCEKKKIRRQSNYDCPTKKRNIRKAPPKGAIKDGKPKEKRIVKRSKTKVAKRKASFSYVRADLDFQNGMGLYSSDDDVNDYFSYEDTMESLASQKITVPSTGATNENQQLCQTWLQRYFGVAFCRRQGERSRGRGQPSLRLTRSSVDASRSDKKSQKTKSDVNASDIGAKCLDSNIQNSSTFHVPEQGQQEQYNQELYHQEIPWKPNLTPPSQEQQTVSSQQPSDGSGLWVERGHHLCPQQGHQTSIYHRPQSLQNQHSPQFHQVQNHQNFMDSQQQIAQQQQQFQQQQKVSILVNVLQQMTNGTQTNMVHQALFSQGMQQPQENRQEPHILLRSRLDCRNPAASNGVGAASVTPTQQGGGRLPVASNCFQNNPLHAASLPSLPIPVNCNLNKDECSGNQRGLSGWAQILPQICYQQTLLERGRTESKGIVLQPINAPSSRKETIPSSGLSQFAAAHPSPWCCSLPTLTPEKGHTGNLCNMTSSAVVSPLTSPEQKTRDTMRICTTNANTTANSSDGITVNTVLNPHDLMSHNIQRKRRHISNRNSMYDYYTDRNSHNVKDGDEDPDKPQHDVSSLPPVVPQTNKKRKMNKEATKITLCRKRGRRVQTEDYSFIKDSRKISKRKRERRRKILFKQRWDHRCLPCVNLNDLSNRLMTFYQSYLDFQQFITDDACRNTHHGRIAIGFGSAADVDTSYSSDIRSNTKDDESQVLGYHALVFEELDQGYDIEDLEEKKKFKQVFSTWMTRWNEGMVGKLDQCLFVKERNNGIISIRSYVKCLHVVYPSQKQIYYAKYLDCTPHYTVTSELELQALLWYAIRHKHVCVKEYLPFCNYSDTSQFLTVYNIDAPGCIYQENENVLDGDNEEALTTEILKHDIFNFVDDSEFVNECSIHLKMKCPKRNIISESLGFMPVNGAGWNTPYPYLSNWGESGKLMRPGISGRLSLRLQPYVVVLLQKLGALMMYAFESTSNTTKSSKEHDREKCRAIKNVEEHVLDEDSHLLYSNQRRRRECAKLFWDALISPSCKEACSGYEGKKSVLSFSASSTSTKDARMNDDVSERFISASSSSETRLDPSPLMVPTAAASVSSLCPSVKSCWLPPMASSSFDVQSFRNTISPSVESSSYSSLEEPISLNFGRNANSPARKKSNQKQKKEVCSCFVCRHIKDREHYDPDNMVFEGVTVIRTCLGERLEIHSDTLNCPLEGYRITGVFSQWTNDSSGRNPIRTGLIGYSRQCCGQWVERLEKAEHAYYTGGYSAFNKLRWVKQSMFRRLEY